jgi:hypothetical protein
MQQWLVNNWIGVLSTALGGVLVWFITYWIGKPIVDVRDKRIKALHAAEQNAHVGYAATDERIVAARTALNEAASALRAVSRGHGWPVRVYCWLARYDLEAAAYALISLHNKTGHPHYDDKTRQLVLDGIYLFLRAHKHLSLKRINEINEQIERDKRLHEAEL